MADRVAEIRARLAAATAGPWRNDPRWPGAIVLETVEAPHWGQVCLQVAVQNCPLIAAAPADLEWACGEIERLTGLLIDAHGDLTEHVGDRECAGPDGNARQGACTDCRIADHIARTLPIPEPKR